MPVLQGLKPKSVWKQFEAICGIPHPSKSEEAVANYIMAEAKRMGLEAKKDQAGSVLVTKPASPGFEKAATIVLQGHMDMVGVAAPGVKHDFIKDPIKVKIEGDYVRAEGTTLGADNGIGGAIMLAIMEEKFPHCKLEFFFTVNEESGMTGAHELKSDFVTGRHLINLDSEEWGEFYISCAGGGDSIITLPVSRDKEEQGAKKVKIHVSGLKGGHSGCDINLGRGSGNVIIARILGNTYKIAPFRLRKIDGGNKRNSIADWATAYVDVPASKFSDFKKSIDETIRTISEELSSTDPGLTVKVEEGSPKETWAPMTTDSTQKVISLLIALPHGVIAMSPAVAGLVETSTNQGLLESQEGFARITLLSRSAVTSALFALKNKIHTIADLVGAKVEEPRGYPGWKPDMNSKLLKVGKDLFKKLYGKEPEVKAIHAGLECGIFSEKLPGVDMLSIGPTLHNPHSPSEELYIPDVPKMYELLIEFIKAMSAPVGIV